MKGEERGKKNWRNEMTSCFRVQKLSNNPCLSVQNCKCSQLHYRLRYTHMCTCMLKLNNLIDLEERLDTIAEQPQLTKNLTHHTHCQVSRQTPLNSFLGQSWNQGVICYLPAIRTAACSWPLTTRHFYPPRPWPVFMNTLPSFALLGLVKETTWGCEETAGCFCRVLS